MQRHAGRVSERLAQQDATQRGGPVTALALAGLVALGGCSQKQATSSGEPAAGSGAAMGSGAPGASRQAGTPARPAQATADRPRRAGPVPPARGAGSATPDPDLTALLDRTLGEAAKRDLEKARKELLAAKRAFDVSETGKQIYAQLGQALQTLEQMGAEAKQGRIDTLSGLAASGYLTVMMALVQLKDLAKDLAKKAVALGKRLQFDKAKSLARDGKALAAAQGAIRKIVARYTETVTALVRSKSPAVRLAAAQALAKAYPKAPDVAKGWIRGAVAAAIAREQDAAAKQKLQALLDGMK